MRETDPTGLDVAAHSRPPSVEDIDRWHDAGAIGDLYLWCQRLRQENHTLREILLRDGDIRRALPVFSQKIGDLEFELITSRELHRRAIDRNNDERLQFQERLAALKTEIATLKNDQQLDEEQQS